MIATNVPQQTSLSSEASSLTQWAKQNSFLKKLPEETLNTLLGASTLSTKEKGAILFS